MNKISIDGFTRISKAKARKLYDSGEDVFLCAVNMRPNFGAVKATKSEWLETKVVDGFVTVVPRNDGFECLCNCFSFYNCDKERGYYPAFYVREADE